MNSKTVLNSEKCNKSIQPTFREEELNFLQQVRIRKYTSYQVNMTAIKKSKIQNSAITRELMIDAPPAITHRRMFSTNYERQSPPWALDPDQNSFKASILQSTPWKSLDSLILKSSAVQTNDTGFHKTSTEVSTPTIVATKSERRNSKFRPLSSERREYIQNARQVTESPPNRFESYVLNRSKSSSLMDHSSPIRKEQNFREKIIPMKKIKSHPNLSASGNLRGSTGSLSLSSSKKPYLTNSEKTLQSQRLALKKTQAGRKSNSLNRLRKINPYLDEVIHSKNKGPSKDHFDFSLPQSRSTNTLDSRISEVYNVSNVNRFKLPETWTVGYNENNLDYKEMPSRNTLTTYQKKNKVYRSEESYFMQPYMKSQVLSIYEFLLTLTKDLGIRGPPELETYPIPYSTSRLIPKCTRCLGPILIDADELCFVEIQSQKFHRWCFTCLVCNRLLSNTIAILRSDELYCSQHF